MNVIAKCPGQSAGARISGAPVDVEPVVALRLPNGQRIFKPPSRFGHTCPSMRTAAAAGPQTRLSNPPINNIAATILSALRLPKPKKLTVHLTTRAAWLPTTLAPIRRQRGARHPSVMRVRGRAVHLLRRACLQAARQGHRRIRSLLRTTSVTCPIVVPCFLSLGTQSRTTRLRQERSSSLSIGRYPRHS
jgi:hypothetical protein